MDVFKFFDAYSLRARLFPALIATAPLLAAAALFISWKSVELANGAATLALLVLLFALADFARARGRILEKELYTRRGGMPSIVIFRRSDGVIDYGTKERYRAFLAHELGTTAPTAEDEAENQSRADAFYEQCGVWLRQNTRDAKKFPLLFGENVTYGFRRNLLALKRIAIGLDLVVVAFSVALLWRGSWNLGTDVAHQASAVLLLCAVHAGYMLLAVTAAAVWDASTAYGRELILSCEAFVSSPTRTAVVRRSTSRQK
jgi:hypothetical protein